MERGEDQIESDLEGNEPRGGQIEGTSKGVRDEEEIENMRRKGGGK